MYGYATDETAELMPLTIMLAHKLNQKLASCRRDGSLPWLRPDTKTQVWARAWPLHGWGCMPACVPNYTTVLSKGSRTVFQHCVLIRPELPFLNLCICTTVVCGVSILLRKVKQYDKWCIMNSLHALNMSGKGHYVLFSMGGIFHFRHLA